MSARMGTCIDIIRNEIHVFPLSSQYNTHLEAHIARLDATGQVQASQGKRTLRRTSSGKKHIIFICSFSCHILILLMPECSDATSNLDCSFSSRQKHGVEQCLTKLPSYPFIHIILVFYNGKILHSVKAVISDPPTRSNSGVGGGRFSTLVQTQQLAYMLTRSMQAPSILAPWRFGVKP